MDTIILWFSSIFAVIVVCSLHVNGVPLSDFYPFGNTTSDSTLRRNDDGSSGPITLTAPFPFFDEDHTTVFVNTNGALSFTHAVGQYTPNSFPLSGSRQLIAPFWADVDTRGAGKIWYRQSTDATLLTRATNEIRGFTGGGTFSPTFLLIATWDHVGYYDRHTDKTNTFQCVMATDSVNSYVIFLYADGDIQWTTGDASGGRGGLGGIRAQVGFNAGDGERFATVPGSRTSDILNIDQTSNVDVPGKWMFRVDQNHIVTVLVMLGLEYDSYSVGEEDGVLDVCVILLDSSHPVPVEVQVETMDGTARAPLDYEELREKVTIETDGKKKCTNVRIRDDHLPEAPKHFTIVISTSDSHPEAILNPRNATVTILDDDVPDEVDLEEGCSIEVVLLAADEEREKLLVLETIDDVLPPKVFPHISVTPGTTDDILPYVYNSLVETLNETATETGYNEFVEAVTEITRAHTEACSGLPDSRVEPDDIPRLVQEYVALKRNTDNLDDLRRVFGKMLCIQSQPSTRRRRGVPVCPEPCTCPEGGLADGDFWCSCQFFRCLDPNDDLKPLFGFQYDRIQSLAFVVDTSGSMGNEIAAAREVITNLITREEDTDVLAYILMPFRDPNFGPSVVAFAEEVGDMQNFVSAVARLQANAGGDCPERALDAILNVLQISDPYLPGVALLSRGSQMVVITDAGTKNVGLAANITSMAKHLGVCIHFIHPMACCCGSGRALYGRIARESGGIVIDTLTNGNAAEMLNQFVEYYRSNPCLATTLPNRRRRQTSSEDGYSDRQLCHTFQVSSLASLLKLVVHSNRRPVTVTRPSGTTAVVRVPHYYASFFENSPEGGEWLACVQTGVFRYTANAAVDIDVTISYVIQETDASKSVVSSSVAPPSCYTTKIILKSSRASDISTASLGLLNNTGEPVETIKLSKCGDVFIGNLTAPLASITYQLKGVDTIGVGFSYTTRQTATSRVGKYSFTTVGPPTTEIERTESPKLVYRLQSLDSRGGYATVEFTASAEPTGGFHVKVQPTVAIIRAGESINVTLVVSAISSTVQGGNLYRFKVSASDGCTNVDSDIHTVSIRDPPTTLPPPDACGNCQNGGTCVEIRRGRRVFHRCQCVDGYTGTLCDIAAG